MCSVCGKKMGMYLIKLKREGALHNITIKVRQESQAAGHKIIIMVH
jgi:hypothetical protein